MNYVQEIADKFLERCQGIRTLGPADFTQIAEWEKQEIPKEVVLDAITKFANPAVRSVLEIRSSVKDYFVAWLAGQRNGDRRRAA
jgi:hypothetical protein